MSVSGRFPARSQVLAHGRPVVSLRGVAALQSMHAEVQRQQRLSLAHVIVSGASAMRERDGPLVNVEDLVIAFRNPARRTPFHAVDRVSLSIGAGEVLGLVGES